VGEKFFSKECEDAKREAIIFQLKNMAKKHSKQLALIFKMLIKGEKLSKRGKDV